MGQRQPLGCSEHVVHLADSPLSAARALAAFVSDGFRHNDSILIVTRPETWNRAAVELPAEHPSLADAIAEGRLVVRDSTRTLSACLAGDMPAEECFEAAVAGLVRAYAARNGQLRVYGDMVDLLARDGRFDAAARLEELWNDLATQVPFTLLCGYSSSHFTNARDGHAVERICALHSGRNCDALDVAAQQLLGTRSPMHAR
jgi:hypothetical protein